MFEWIDSILFCTSHRNFCIFTDLEVDIALINNKGMLFMTTMERA